MLSICSIQGNINYNYNEAAIHSYSKVKTDGWTISRVWENVKWQVVSNTASINDTANLENKTKGSYRLTI